MEYGYARVSKADDAQENLLGQIEELVKAGIPKECIFSEIASGAKADRVALNEVINVLGEGDCLVVLSFTRFGRNFNAAMRAIAEIESNGATLRSVHEGLDGTTSMGKFVTRLLLGIAELQWDDTRRRSIEGARRAKDAGRQAGPKYKLGPEQRAQVVEWLEAGVSKRQIGKRLGVNRQMVIRIAQRQGLID